MIKLLSLLRLKVPLWLLIAVTVFVAGGLAAQHRLLGRMSAELAEALSARNTLSAAVQAGDTEREALRRQLSEGEAVCRRELADCWLINELIPVPQAINAPADHSSSAGAPSREVIDDETSAALVDFINAHLE